MASPRFAWGVDVGNRALKAIRLARDGDQYRIDDFEVIEHEYILSEAGDNRDSLLQTSLANFAQKHKAKGGTVAIGVTGQASFARFIKLPPVDPNKIPDIVKFEAIQQIPFPLSEVEWSYQLFQAPDSPEVEVGIFAIKRELVNGFIKNFTDVGLEVSVVQMNPLAVYNGLIYDKRIEGTTMVVDVGSENSDLIIADGETVWMRSIPIGGNNFTEALTKSFKLKFQKAEELKRNAATSKYGRQILQAMKPVFSDLVGEIQRSIGFYSSTHRESRIGKVLALGGTFRLPGLQKYLQQNLQLEVARIDHLNAPMPSDAKFAGTFNENILSSIGAYGLALQAVEEAKIKSSLLPEKIRRERMWRAKVPWFAAAAALFVVGTGIGFTKYYIDRNAFDTQLATYDPKIKLVSSRAIDLDRQWKKLENSGNDDRTLITNYMSLLSDRDLGIETCQALAKAFPPPSPAEMSKPRGERKVVELIGWKVRYFPDVSDWVDQQNDRFVKGESDFIKLAEKVDMAAEQRAVTDPFNFKGSAPGGGTGTTAKPGAPRGFIVTLLCKTPYRREPQQVVFDQVVTKLRAQRLLPLDEPRKPDEKPPLISIERVSITQKEQVDEVYKSGTARTPRPPMSFVPPNAAGVNEPPPTPPAPPPSIGPVEPQYPDPMIKGESMGKDSLVTVLVAIVIDPVDKMSPNASNKRKAEPAKAVVAPANKPAPAVGAGACAFGFAWAGDETSDAENNARSASQRGTGDTTLGGCKIAAEFSVLGKLAV
jgi:type IV pilus assembly protein PilM